MQPFFAVRGSVLRLAPAPVLQELLTDSPPGLSDVVHVLSSRAACDRRLVASLAGHASQGRSVAVVFPAVAKTRLLEGLGVAPASEGGAPASAALTTDAWPSAGAPDVAVAVARIREANRTLAVLSGSADAAWAGYRDSIPGVVSFDRATARLLKAAVRASGGALPAALTGGEGNAPRALAAAALSNLANDGLPPRLPGSGVSMVAGLVTERQRASDGAAALLEGGGTGAAPVKRLGTAAPREAGSESPSSAVVRCRTALLDAARDGDVTALRQGLDCAESLVAAAAASTEMQPVLACPPFKDAIYDGVHGASLLHLFVTSVPALTDGAALQEGLEVLLGAGADVNALSSNGSTPLHWAAGAGNLGAVLALLDAGADPSRRTYTWGRQVFGRGSGQTPLHWAAESNQLPVIEALSAATVAGGYAIDERGYTPADLAKKELANEAVAALAAHTAAERWHALRLTVSYADAVLA